jgi:hypothetical protein
MTQRKSHFKGILDGKNVRIEKLWYWTTTKYFLPSSTIRMLPSSEKKRGILQKCNQDISM